MPQLLCTLDHVTYYCFYRIIALEYLHVEHQTLQLFVNQGLSRCFYLARHIINKNSKTLTYLAESILTSKTAKIFVQS